MTLELLMLIIGLLGTYEGYRLTHTNLLYSDSVGPGWYLLFMAAILLICGIGLLSRRITKSKAIQGEVAVLLHKGAAGRAFLLLFAYTACISYLGYVISSILFFSVVQWIFGERSWVRSTAIGLSITACFWFIFSYLASVPLP